MLSEALAVVDPATHSYFAGKAAVALAEAGLAERPRAKIAENLERWPGMVQSGPGSSPVTRWPSSAMAKRRSPISRWPCRWHSRPRTTRRSVTCPREYSGSPVPPPVRRCSGASPGPGGPDPSARADGNRVRADRAARHIDWEELGCRDAASGWQREECGADGGLTWISQADAGLTRPELAPAGFVRHGVGVLLAEHAFAVSKNLAEQPFSFVVPALVGDRLR